MRNLFFYGTLRHLPLLEIVLGQDVGALDLTPAVLPDHAVLSVAEGPFPTIVAQKSARAEGVLVRGLSADQIARLDFYEGSFAYDLLAVTLEGGQVAEVYFPQPGLWTGQGQWSLAAWEADWGALSCHAAREVMAHRGVRSRDEVAEMFPMIRARAASKVTAATSRHGQGTLHGQVDVRAMRYGYAKYFALQEWQLRHERFDGSMSPEVERAVFVATDAALVLPYDPVRDRVLVIEQMRMGPLARGDSAVWQFEPVAGRCDPGETPEQTAHREAREEAGLSLDRLERVAEVYASPGDSTEFFHIYVGLTDLPDTVTGVAGLDSEHEDIRSHLMSLDELLVLCDDQRAANAPLVIAAYWLGRHRERLRLDGREATP